MNQIPAPPNHAQQRTRVRVTACTLTTSTFPPAQVLNMRLIPIHVIIGTEFSARSANGATQASSGQAKRRPGFAAIQAEVLKGHDKFGRSVTPFQG